MYPSTSSRETSGLSGKQTNCFRRDHTLSVCCFTDKHLICYCWRPWNFYWRNGIVSEWTLMENWDSNMLKQVLAWPFRSGDWHITWSQTKQLVHSFISTFCMVRSCLQYKASVVQWRITLWIHQIKQYPMDIVVCFTNAYPRCIEDITQRREDSSSRKSNLGTRAASEQNILLNTRKQHSYL